MMKGRNLAGRALAVLVLCLVARPCDARMGRRGALVISRAWVRAPPNGVDAAAAYLTITNRGGRSDRLLRGVATGVSSIAAHSMTMAGGVMRMREMNSGLAIPPGAVVVLAPGRDHLMLMGLTTELKVGQHLRVMLIFAKAGAMKVDFPVRVTPP